MGLFADRGQTTPGRVLLPKQSGHVPVVGVSRCVHSGSSILESESESESESEDEGVSDAGSFVVVADADSDVPAPSFVLAPWSARVPAMVPSRVGFAPCESPCGGHRRGYLRVRGRDIFLSERGPARRKRAPCLP
jgi:hypothetical protein